MSTVLLTKKQKVEVRRAAMLAATPAGDCLLSAPQVAARLSIGVRSLWRWVEEDKFPQPIRFTRKLVRWHSAVVQKYLDGLLQQTTPAPASDAVALYA